MMFENIKVGDEVLEYCSVGYGWNEGESFYLKAIVTAITKTQFKIGNIKYKKDTGARIGHRGECYPIGYERRGTPLKDETDEYKLFKSHISVYNKCYSSLRSLERFNVTIDFGNDTLSKINSLLDEVIETINIENKMLNK